MTVGQLRELLDETIRVHGVVSEDWDVKISFEQAYGSSLACNILDTSAIQSTERTAGETVLNVTDAVGRYVENLSYRMVAEKLVEGVDRDEFVTWAKQKQLEEIVDREGSGTGLVDSVWLRVSANSGFGSYVAPSWIRSTASVDELDLTEEELSDVRAAWLNYQSDGI